LLVYCKLSEDLRGPNRILFIIPEGGAEGQAEGSENEDSVELAELALLSLAVEAPELAQGFYD